jgi:hypothetical protein
VTAASFLVLAIVHIGNAWRRTLSEACSQPTRRQQNSSPCRTQGGCRR